MPEVRIEIREGRAPLEKKALLEAVHSALVEALRIPEHDRIQRLHDLPSECFEIPPYRTGMFALIEVTMFPGRSLDAKGKLDGPPEDPPGQAPLVEGFLLELNRIARHHQDDSRRGFGQVLGVALQDGEPSWCPPVADHQSSSGTKSSD